MSQSGLFKKTVSEQEYKSYVNSLNMADYVKSDKKEIAKIEEVLEVRAGLLVGEDYYVYRTACKCGRNISFLDFVNTSIEQGAHTKSFLVHALLNNKFGFQEPRAVKCSNCGEIHITYYTTPNYSCPNGGVN
jgi:hypothetical protein